MMSDNKYTHWVDEVRKQETGEVARWPIIDENGFSNNLTILTTIEFIQRIKQREKNVILCINMSSS